VANKPYVGSGRATVAHLASQDEPCHVAILARLLTKAGADQVVRYRNGDRVVDALDLIKAKS
jgi:hypothetical protein